MPSASLEPPEGGPPLLSLSRLGTAEEAESPHKPPWNKVKGSSDCSLLRPPAYRKEREPAVEESALNQESADGGSDSQHHWLTRDPSLSFLI